MNIFWKTFYLFHKGHGIGINRFNTRLISGHPISYNDYYNRYHGFRIVDRGFHYNGLGQLTYLLCIYLIEYIINFQI